MIYAVWKVYVPKVSFLPSETLFPQFCSEDFLTMNKNGGSAKNVIEKRQSRRHGGGVGGWIDWYYQIMRKDKLLKKKKFTLTAPFSYVFDELLWLDGMKSISVYYANNHTSDPFVPAVKQSRYIAKEFVYFYRFLTQMFFFKSWSQRYQSDEYAAGRKRSCSRRQNFVFNYIPL